MSGRYLAGGASVSDSVRFVHDVLEVIGVSVCVCVFFRKLNCCFAVGFGCIESPSYRQPAWIGERPVINVAPSGEVMCTNID